MPSYLLSQIKPLAKHLLHADKARWTEVSRHWASNPVRRTPYANRAELWRAKTTFPRTQRHAARSHKALGTGGCTYLGRRLDMATAWGRALPRAALSTAIAAQRLE